MSGEDAITVAYRARLDWRNPEARLLLADLAEACHVAKSTLVPGDPLATAHAEGKRTIFLYIAGRIGLPLLPEV